MIIKNYKALIFFALMFQVRFVLGAQSCVNLFSQNETAQPNPYLQNNVGTFKSYTDPSLRHQVLYARFDPAAQNPNNLIPIQISDPKIRIPTQVQKISYRQKDYFMYDVGEKHLLSLNQVYENTIQSHPSYSLPTTLGFKVSANAKLGFDIKFLSTLREAALLSVVRQFDADIANQTAIGKYSNYNFYRQIRWQTNHQLKANGDNDVFAIFENEVEKSKLPTVDNLSLRVAATIQVSYPTSRQFPQDYVFSDSIGTSRLEILPTIKTWRRGISEADFSKLKEITGTKTVAEIGRYINVSNVPLPIIAKMLLSAFEQIEKRGVQTIFVFGSASNIRMFKRFYKFREVENFSYNVLVPETGLPAEQGYAAFHEIGSPAYMSMKEDLKKLAETI